MKILFIKRKENKSISEFKYCHYYYSAAAWLIVIAVHLVVMMDEMHLMELL
jgi:hypothetical protein